MRASILSPALRYRLPSYCLATENSDEALSCSKDSIKGELYQPPFLCWGTIIGKKVANMQRDKISAWMVSCKVRTFLISDKCRVMQGWWCGLIMFLCTENILTWLRTWLDNCIRGNLHQAAVGKFCQSDSDQFAFHLCNKAGGLGINLKAADTVIIYNSGWNSQNGLQSHTLAHIGQQKWSRFIGKGLMLL